VAQLKDVPDFRTKELRREAIRRGLVLVRLKLNHPYPTCDSSLQAQLQVDYPETEYQFSELEVRQILDYLSGHKLIQLEIGATRWAAKINSQGIDYLAGVGESMPGVNRS
jgi:hypothetical protein